MRRGGDRKRGLGGFWLVLPLVWAWRRLPHNKGGEGGGRRRKQHKPQQQLGAQSQVVVAFLERLQNTAYPCKMNRLPPVMRGLKRVSSIRLGRMTNDLIHLEFACQARKSYKVTFLSQIGNGHSVPRKEYTGARGD